LTDFENYGKINNVVKRRKTWTTV